MDKLLFGDYPNFYATKHRRHVQCYTFSDTRRYNARTTSVSCADDIDKFLDPIEFPVFVGAGQMKDIFVFVMDGNVSIERVMLMKSTNETQGQQIQHLEPSKWKSFKKEDKSILVGDNIFLEHVTDSWRFDFFFHIDLKIEEQEDSVNTQKFKLGSHKKRNSTQIDLTVDDLNEILLKKQKNEEDEKTIVSSRGNTLT